MTGASFSAKMLLVLVPLLAFNAFLAVDLHRLSVRRDRIKQDYSQVNSIRYGLLSVDAWKEKIQAVLSDRVGDFELSKAQERVLRGEISNVLHALITEAERSLRDRQKTLSGKLRNLAVRAFLDVGDVRKKVPQFAQAVLDQLKSAAHTKKFRKMARSQLDGYAARTYDDAAETEHRNAVLRRYQAADAAAFSRRAELDIRALDARMREDCILMLDSALAFLFAWWLARKKPEAHKALFSLSGAFAALLLAVGLALPMIDLDARIEDLGFQLWGSRLEFQDQVLFFRSKSILQVIRVLLEARQADSVAVGLLLLAFSVAFPVLKLAAMELQMRGGPAVRANRLASFFAFKSGKWSMADVTVVSIFIAFIGFKRILNSELAGLAVRTEYVEIIATNDTALQPGFVLFTAFVLFGFALSGILERVRPGREEGPPSRRPAPAAAGFEPLPAAPREGVGELRAEVEDLGAVIGPQQEGHQGPGGPVRAGGAQLPQVEPQRQAAQSEQHAGQEASRRAVPP